MGHAVSCELLATKTIVPEDLRPVYSHCAIIGAPHHLPDGDYEVEFGDEVAITRKQGGVWTVGSVLPHTYQETARFYAARENAKPKAESRRRMRDSDDLLSSRTQ